ncbi:myopalladin isoform X1 [Phacochoerus africanus]|uniref:myopalladin isoform X1 n=1 Tax=Phacochoerus africanus TaxID=41426 RepID=UPI001FD93B0C|nr:myopalladin isoform X1 [Phacochoerus africanus]XP_047617403.1 myopalladin isoform X1 [Phacochoerus africanus]XP_047617406.1 myopalladin isoform X1 [Phacochoerus africanus]
MQDDSLEASTSISQLLRESYLAETRHQGNNERSRAEPSSNPFHFSSPSGAAEGGGGQDDLPDLSAFLSQEELDESVNLARLAINHDPLEKADDTPARKRFSSDQMKHSPKSSFDPSFCQDNSRSPTNSKESLQEAKRPQYSSETQSKKVFLNKAADFIEELSSLFKAHSSKRIRPRACKNHKSKLESQNKVMQENSSSFSDLSERRERSSVPIPIPADTRDNEVNHALEQQEAKRREAEQAAGEAAGGDTTPGSSPSSLYYEEPLGQPPRFTQKLRSREVPEGTRVQLDCIVVGIPPPQVRWYCEGKELENSPDIHIIQAGNLHSLTIAEAFEEDTGRYSCFASNIYGTDSTSAEIYIEGVSSSDSEGDPNKGEMNRIQKPNEVSSPPTTSAAIPSAGPPAQNVGAQPTVSTIQQCQSPTNYLQGLDGKPIIAAPVFTKMLQNLSASEGQLVVFECRVKGAPSPKVEWYREGTLIEDSPDFRILQKKPRSMAEPEEICTLVIAEVFAEDSGCFTCTASNKYGTVSSIAQLDVRGSEDLRSNGSLHSANSTTNLAVIEQQPSPPNPEPPSVEQPPKPKLEGVLVNHNEPRSSSRIGLRVHFNLPEDDKGSEASSEGGMVTINQTRPDSFQERFNGQSAKISEPSSPVKEPPPVLAKPKLDSSQLQQLHNQVLLEQQQLQNPSPSSPKEFPFHMSVLNSSAAPAVTMSSKQVKAPSSQTFSLVRPKHFFPSASTASATVSPSSSPVFALSSTPQAMQRTVSKESLLVSHPLAQTKSLGGVSVQNEPPAPGPVEPAQPPLTFSISSGNQFQPRCVSPTPVSPTSRIQNPVAFLSSVLPSLPAIPPTNAMGLPRSAPTVPSQGLMKKNTKSSQSVSDDYIRETKNAVILDLGKKMNFSDVRSNQQEYKISSFEQRLMNEIEFRLERTPVDESDDEIQHDEIPTGKCIAPIFDKRLKHFRVTEGSPVTFTCKIVGIPVPKVYWFKDGKQISKRNEHCKMRREGDGTCSLHIDSTTSDDDGNYTIMAANPQGRISCSGHLMVQGLPIRSRLTAASQSHRGRSRVQERDKEPLQERFFRPHFLQAPGDMVAHEGRLCRLDCKVSGLPPPELTWLLNGQPVLPDASHKMLVRETGVHSLLIDPLTQHDAGTYTCVATNKTGQNSFSLELTVVAKEVKKAPVILEKLQNSGVPEGHPVRLECRVIGMPPPVFYWKKDNETIPFTRERISMHQDTTGYVCLLIQPAKKSDAGWYTLSAKNEAGIVSCTARLDIYAQWHHQIPPPMSVRPSGSRYGSLTSKGLDIFSAFSSVESTMVYSCSSRSVVESDEL